MWLLLIQYPPSPPQTCIVLQYVDGLLADIVSFQPELKQVLQQLQDQARHAAQASEADAAQFTGKTATAKRKRIKPEPFNLTQPKPKRQPIQEPLPPPIKYAQETVCPLCTSAVFEHVHPSQSHAGGRIKIWACVVLLCCLHCFMHDRTAFTA